MKKVVSFVMFLFLLATGSVGFTAQQNLQAVYIITANDFHGHLRADNYDPGAAWWAGVIDQLRKENPEGAIVLGAGDMFTGTLDANESHGLPSIKVMNAVGFAADTVGNHKFDVSRKDIELNAKAANFPLLSANIIDEQTKKVAKPFKPYIIVEHSGIKVGIIGLTTIETISKATQKNLIGLTVLPPETVAQKYIDEVRNKGAQVVILLTHIGSAQGHNGDIIGEITGLLDKVHGVDLAITGHTHLTVAGSYRHIPVLQAGCYGQAVGEAKIVYSKKEGKVQAVNVKYIQVKDMPVYIDKKVEKISDAVTKQIDAKYNEVLAVNKQVLNNDLLGQSATGEYFCDLMRKGMQVDIVFFNGGGVRSGVQKGNVTYRTINNVFPFSNNMVKLAMTGKDVREVLEHGVSNTGLRMLRFSGLKVIADVNKSEGQRMLSVTTLDGKPLDDGAIYLVGTNDFLSLGGDGFVTFKNCQTLAVLNGTVEMCAEFLKKQKYIDYKGPDGRLQY